MLKCSVRRLVVEIVPAAEIAEDEARNPMMRVQSSMGKSAAVALVCAGCGVAVCMVVVSRTVGADGMGQTLRTAGCSM